MWFTSKRRDQDAAPPVGAPVAAAAPPVRIERRRDGRIIAVTGSSRSGKTTWIARQVKGARRVLAWDYPKGEWHSKYGFRRVSDFRELAQLVGPGSKPARLAFMRASETPEKDFEAWARIAWGYIQLHGAPVIAEELSSVTHPGKAPPAWGNVCRMGAGYGSDIYAVTQRPAESDKTALGNASLIHCGRMAIPDDRALMARYLDVPVSEVARLEQFQFIERDALGRITRGRV